MIKTLSTLALLAILVSCAHTGSDIPSPDGDTPRPQTLREWWGGERFGI